MSHGEGVFGHFNSWDF